MTQINFWNWTNTWDAEGKHSHWLGYPEVFSAWVKLTLFQIQISFPDQLDPNLSHEPHQNDNPGEARTHHSAMLINEHN